MSAHGLTQPKTLDDMLLYRLWQVQTRAGRGVNRLCEVEFGITRREWRVLAQLAQGDGLQSSALAERAELDRAQTSRAVTRLTGKRLLARMPRPGNRREVALHLTDQGRALYAALLPRVAQLNRELMSVLTAAEADAFEDALARLRDKAESMFRAAPGSDTDDLD